MRILTLDAGDVAAALPMSDCIGEMAKAFALQGEGKLESTPRTKLAAPSGDVLVMPSMVIRGKAEASVKVVSVFPRNKPGIPSISALTMLVDGETGEPRALISGGVLTAIRTGAVSGLSCEYLAREGSETLGIVGAGGMAFQQVSGVVTALPSIRKVKIFSLEASRSKEMAQECKSIGLNAEVVGEVDSCVRGSDVVVTATTARTPVFDGSLVEDGTHVIAMGSYKPDARELDSDLVARASIFVDSREAVLEEAGDLLIPMGEGRITKGAIRGELGELVTGKKRGRKTGSEVTLFKCVGLAFEDNAAGWLAYRRAAKQGRGRWSDL